MRIQESEFILNPNGSIYHLNLLPEQVSDTIITVGDPDRVAMISKHFDSIEHQSQKREIKTHSGSYKGTKITVISTGMGSDNIDIVLNELDALANIDFSKREKKEELKKLKIIRIGTSGSLQKNIPIDSYLVSKKAIGLDGLLHFYNSIAIRDIDFEKELFEQINFPINIAKPYVVNASEELLNLFKECDFIYGNTITAGGFYGPQGRVLRIPLAEERLNDAYRDFVFRSNKLSNFEMETAAIYGLSKLLGHEAISINCILANRETKEFSVKSKQKMDDLIELVLNKIVHS